MSAGKLSQAELHALAALASSQKIVPRFEAAQWLGVCPHGHVIAAVMDLSREVCMDCVPTGMDEGRPRYLSLPRQDVMLATFRLGGLDAVRQLARDLMEAVP